MDNQEAQEQKPAARASLHAHWDCSNGVSGYSMFAACLDATKKDEAQRQLIEVEKLITKGIPQDVLLKKFSLQMRRSNAAMRVTVVHKRALSESSASPSAPETSLVTVDEMPQVNGSQIQTMLEEADRNSIPRWVRENSLAVLQEMGKAASAICQTDSVDPVHIDYGMDMIIEIVGTLLSLDSLGVRTVSCSPIPLGVGSFGMSVPQPAPLTLQLMIGLPTFSGPPALGGEFVTASGAALLRVLTGASKAQPVKRPPPLTLRAIGFGVSELHHMVRLSVGEIVTDLFENRNQPAIRPEPNLESSHWDVENLLCMEANLDDITAEQLAFAVDLLLENGAVDAWVTPIVMKKGRAAHTLHCLCHSAGTDKGAAAANHIRNILEIIFKQTTTLGVRIHQNMSRVALRRSIFKVKNPHAAASTRGTVDVKVARLGNTVVSVKPEFEHCKEISLSTGLPIKQVTDSAVQATKEQMENGNAIEAHAV